jgi:hypothetical protein
MVVVAFVAYIGFGIYLSGYLIIGINYGLGLYGSKIGAIYDDLL